MDISRRKLILVAGVLAGSVTFPLSSLVLAKRNSLQRYEWSGIVLGAEASISIYHYDKDRARDIINRSVLEITRLEKIFSLYNEDSDLSRLNKDGVLYNPKTELLNLINLSRYYGAMTCGRFDITVQPLWEFFNANSDQLATVDTSSARELVDYKMISADPHQIRFAKNGMKITLNGIAQGYITDRIIHLLMADNLKAVMVNLGELRSIGSHDAEILNPNRSNIKINLKDKAIATSGGYGMKFDKKFSHIIDPMMETDSNIDYTSVSVIADSATIADALSTAFYLMPLSDIKDVLQKLNSSTEVIIIDNNGKVIKV